MADFGKLSDWLREHAGEQAGATQEWHDQLLAWADEYDGLLAKVDKLNTSVTALAMENVKLKQRLKRRGGNP